MAEERTRIVAGCMTGTSLDGLDVALVKIIGTGLEMRAELLGHAALSLPGDLRGALMSLASGEAREPIVTMRAARALGELHADGLEQLLAGGLVPPLGSPGSLDFVTAHGQTIWHAPRDGKAEPGGGPKSWQLFDPWPIVRRLYVPVCYDLRQADLIAGGEGAPLTPIADWVMYRSDDPIRVVINLGGVANATVLAGDLNQIYASDICLCNILIDNAVQAFFPDTRYDKDGEISRRTWFEPWVDELIRLPYMNPSESTGSLGREDYDSAWLDHRVNTAILDDEDDYLSVGSAVHAVAQSLTDHVIKKWMPYRVILAGGGARNHTLVRSIRERANLDRYLILSDELGIPCEAREAMGFAVLGALSQDGVPISLPQVTGATDPGVAGVWAGL